MYCSDCSEVKYNTHKKKLLNKIWYDERASYLKMKHTRSDFSEKIIVPLKKTND